MFTFLRMKRDWVYIIVAVIVVLLVLLVWVGSFLLICYYLKDWTERGQFGDLFGAVNALFSGLAFAGLIMTIWLQRRDLQYQRESIEQTNQEMQHQTRKIDIQNKTLKQQQFDNTFFELLRMLQTIVDDLTLNVEYSRYIDMPDKKSSFTCTGRNVFQELFINRFYKVVAGSSQGIESLHDEIKNNGVDRTFVRDELQFLSHYIRFVYRIVKYVDETTLLANDDEKYNYVSFLRATLSNYEQMILFYKCNTKTGQKYVMPLFDRYDLFGNIDVNRLMNNIEGNNATS